MPRVLVGLVPVCVTILGCASAVPAVFGEEDGGAKLSTGAGGFSNVGTGGVPSANGGFPSTSGGFPSTSGGFPSETGGSPNAGNGGSNTGGTAGLFGGGGTAGAAHGSGGMQTASCMNLACFDVFDCAFLYLGNTCGFTQCVGGICK